ncbi:exopolyphosphatase PRUNE1-like [Vitis riparia]|uniref:exopolyphosphatase PRUNE1-like n=1 Tax=Vitis riparia TaxID=96939 RepID=UPI00155B0ADE|nr:exopolyphosphatase PRUNE1-like [Vitis riparia]
MSGSHQEPYIRKQLRKGGATLMDRYSNFGIHGSVTSRKISRASSDAGDSGPRSIVSDISEKVVDKSSEDVVSDSLVEPSGQSLSGKKSKLPRKTSFAFPIIKSDLNVDLDEGDDTVETSLTAHETDVDCYTSSDTARPTIERSYSVNKRKSSLSKIPLPQSAASFYIGDSPHMEVVESCESINRLNSYLKASRDEVNAGVPGRFLHAVMGQDFSDVSLVASTIMYAFYLNETRKIGQFCTVPVINMKRADLSSHAEIKWLLNSCQIDQSSLIFLDEIDLSYYDLFGGLKLVLLNGDRLPTKQEAFKEAVVEIFGCKKDSEYPWVETVTAGQDCSCCTLIAENFALYSPEILAGKGFSRLLLASILLDTGNLTYHHCTSKDKYIATLLINGAGRFGCNGLYQILRYKMYDVSDLKVKDILRKDFKKWMRVGKPDGAGSRGMGSYIGMSSIGISVAQLLVHKDTATQEIVYFQQSEKIRLLMIVSGYYDRQKNFKRELLVSAESVDLMKNLLHFFNSNASQLPLKVLHQPGLRDEMRAFEVDQVTSRRTIEQLLDEFGGTSKR